MKTAILLSLLTLSLGCSLFSRSKLVAVNQTVYYQNVSPKQVKEIMDSDENFLLIDVRTIEEFKGGHLKGAKHLPIGNIDSWIKELEHNTKIIVYCHSGGRSARASSKLAIRNFKTVYNMEGGISDWHYEIVK